VLHPLRQMLCPRSTVNGVTHHGTPSLKEGELLETCSVFPLRRFLGPTLLCKLSLKDGDSSCKTFNFSMIRGKHYECSTSARHSRSDASHSTTVTWSSASLIWRVAPSRPTSAS
jgi:hypothetical protein